MGYLLDFKGMLTKLFLLCVTFLTCLLACKNYQPTGLRLMLFRFIKSLIKVRLKITDQCHYFVFVRRLWKGPYLTLFFQSLRIYHLQHRFVKGRSTVTQLLTVFQEISCTLDRAGQVDMIYLDFSKAFDSVSHNLLIHKLKSLVFIRNFLTGLNRIYLAVSKEWL